MLQIFVPLCIYKIGGLDVFMKILVIIPAYNEQENIAQLLTKLKLVKIQGCRIDAVVINDKSTDSTSQICKDFGVNTIDLPCNLGIGGAVQTGYKYAFQNKYDIAVQMDGDGQHNPEYLSVLITPLLEGKTDMVIGSRYIENQGFQSTFMRRVGIRYFSRLIKFLTSQNFTDPTSGFRACNTKVISLFARRYPQDYPEPESIVFLKRNKFLIEEVPVVMQERKGGVSSISRVKSVYYMVKVSLAIAIDVLRKQTT
jgi:glycosyltransferase involved in cell wall biosynthesis